MHEATQVTRMYDAVAFLSKANLDRNIHLGEFQGNVEKWTTDHQRKVETLERQWNEDRQRVTGLEQQLARAQDELIRVATAVPLPATPKEQTQTDPIAAQELTPAPMTCLVLGSPLLGQTRRCQRPSALPAVGGAGGRGSPPRPPRRTAPPSPSPPPSQSDGDLYE